MPDNGILISGQPVASRDRGNVQHQVFLDGASVNPAVLIAAIGTTTSSPAFTASATRRQISIKNTGTTQVEVSPTINFAWGAGMPLDPGEAMGSNSNGAFYARVNTGTGQLRAWSED